MGHFSLLAIALIYNFHVQRSFSNEKLKFKFLSLSLPPSLSLPLFDNVVSE